MQQNTHYNYIIAGAGCAGLSLVMRMVASSFFANKKILLIDKQIKTANDRTWCFWEKQTNFFENCIDHKWENLIFKSEAKNIKQNILPYTYKLIRSSKLYNHCFTEFKKHSNVSIVYGNISDINTESTSLTVDGINYTADKIFSSILLEEPALKNKDIYLLQHFKGYFIETTKPCFNENEATLMDFSVTQKHGDSFVYIMPFSTTKALVEFTLFTENVLEENEYKQEIENFISKNMGIDSYKILEQEYGIIPMTNLEFTTQQNNTYYIGTAGGATKASSGYTFTFIQKQAASIINMLVNNKPLQATHKQRYNFFDDILLYLIATKKLPLAKIFERLFAKNSMQQIFKFLDEEASILENIKLCLTLQISTFTKAAFTRLFK